MVTPRTDHNWCMRSPVHGRFSNLKHPWFLLMDYNVPLGRLSIARGAWRDYTCIEFSDYLKKYAETHQWLWADVVILVSNCTRSFLLATCTLHQIPQNIFTHVYVSVWLHVCVYTDVVRYGWCNSTLSLETFLISLPFHHDSMQLGALNSTKMTPDTNSRLNHIIVWREPDIVSVDRVLVKVHRANFLLSTSEAWLV